MQCPIDKADLVMADRQGVEIDYCPKCRGVWLDRGELDKIIERAPTQTAAPVSLPQQESSYSSKQYDKSGDNNKDYADRKRKESFLGELFDF